MTMLPKGIFTPLGKDVLQIQHFLMRIQSRQMFVLFVATEIAGKFKNLDQYPS